MTEYTTPPCQLRSTTPSPEVKCRGRKVLSVMENFAKSILKTYRFAWYPFGSGAVENQLEVRLPWFATYARTTKSISHVSLKQ